MEFSDGLYHVIARGDRRALIFHDDADYRTYLARLRQSQQRDELVCNAYVLKTNHVSLLVENGGIPSSRIFQTLQFTYSQYYNWRYREGGACVSGKG